MVWVRVRVMYTSSARARVSARVSGLHGFQMGIV